MLCNDELVCGSRKNKGRIRSVYADEKIRFQQSLSTWGGGAGSYSEIPSESGVQYHVDFCTDINLLRVSMQKCLD